MFPDNSRKSAYLVDNNVYQEKYNIVAALFRNYIIIT